MSAFESNVVFVEYGIGLGAVLLGVKADVGGGGDGLLGADHCGIGLVPGGFLLFGVLVDGAEGGDDLFRLRGQKYLNHGSEFAIKGNDFIRPMIFW